MTVHRNPYTCWAIVSSSSTLTSTSSSGSSPPITSPPSPLIWYHCIRVCVIFSSRPPVFSTSLMSCFHIFSPPISSSLLFSPLLFPSLLFSSLLSSPLLFSPLPFSTLPPYSLRLSPFWSHMSSDPLLVISLLSFLRSYLLHPVSAPFPHLPPSPLPPPHSTPLRSRSAVPPLLQSPFSSVPLSPSPPQRQPGSRSGAREAEKRGGMGRETERSPPPPPPPVAVEAI
jgi:hypothetical protein